MSNGDDTSDMFHGTNGITVEEYERQLAAERAKRPVAPAPAPAPEWTPDPAFDPLAFLLS